MRPTLRSLCVLARLCCVRCSVLCRLVSDDRRLRACLLRISTPPCLLASDQHSFDPNSFAFLLCSFSFCLSLTYRSQHESTFRGLVFRTYACCLCFPFVVVLLAVCVARRALSPPSPGTPSSLLPIISTRVYLCSDRYNCVCYFPPFIFSHYVRLARRNSYHVPLGCDH